MDNQSAYNAWSDTYDTVPNKTRDIEAIALRQTLAAFNFSHILEIGCGTGKNTEWLLTRTQVLTGVDFSGQMLEKAKQKITVANVQFRQADIRLPWHFVQAPIDLVTCSLVLEHIADINFVFQEAKRVLTKGGLLYIGELHPFKQYQGSKARFDTANGVFELQCFIHHVSDYFAVAASNGFTCLEIKEWFDDNDKKSIPRLLTMLFKV